MRIVPFVLALVISAPGLATSVNTETIFGNPVSEGARHMNMSPTRLDDPTSLGGDYERSTWRVVLAAQELMKEGRHAEAADMLNGISLTHVPDANRLAGVANAMAGNLPEAEQYLERALVRDARDSAATATLGWVRLQLGKRADAEELLRSLEKRQQRCASRCERAAEIDRATEVLARALG